MTVNACVSCMQHSRWEHHWEEKHRPCFKSGSQTETRQTRTGGWESLSFIFLGFLSAFIGWQIQLIPGELVREKLQPTQRWSLFYLRSWQTETFVSWALVVVSLVFFCRTGFIPGDRIRFDRLKTDSARQVFAVWFQFPLVSSGKSPSSVRLLCVMCNSNKLFFNMNRK